MSIGSEPKIELKSETPHYSIPIEDFAREPDALSEYRLGDKVTRENFISLLILSFAMSRGRPHIQKIFFKWLEKKYGFDYSTTIIHFSNRNGWNSLIDKEKEIFRKSFHRVDRHAEMYFPGRHEEAIEGEVDRLTSILLGNNIGQKYADEFFDLDSISSLSDFSTYTNKYLQDLKTARQV
jgi:hypothetical protein